MGAGLLPMRIQEAYDQVYVENWRQLFDLAELEQAYELSI